MLGMDSPPPNPPRHWGQRQLEPPPSPAPGAPKMSLPRLLALLAGPRSALPPSGPHAMWDWGAEWVCGGGLGSGAGGLIL